MNKFTAVTFLAVVIAVAGSHNASAQKAPTAPQAAPQIVFTTNYPALVGTAAPYSLDIRIQWSGAPAGSSVKVSIYNSTTGNGALLVDPPPTKNNVNPNDTWTFTQPLPGPPTVNPGDSILIRANLYNPKTNVLIATTGPAYVTIPKP